MDYELGAIAMRLLIERLNGVRDGDRIVSKIIKTNLVVRQSTVKKVASENVCFTSLHEFE